MSLAPSERNELYRDSPCQLLYLRQGSPRHLSFTNLRYTATQAFFRFRIPEHGVNELFLFAGSVVEPDISVDRTRVDYGALMLGAALKETFHIVNREGMPHSFVFDKNSLGMAQVNLK